jgi:hypothetical protein
VATSTRLLIRQTAAARLGGLTTGAATSNVTAPTATVTDTGNLLDTGDSDYNYVGEYFMFSSGSNAGAVRRVTSYIPATGVVALGANLTSNIVIGDTFELHAHLSPTQWNECIDAALRRCTRRREESVTVVTNQNQYALTALTDLTREKQVLGVSLRRGSSLQKTQRGLARQADYEFWEDDDSLTLNLLSAVGANATDNLELIVAYIAPYAALSTDASTTTCDLDWVVTGTLLHALERYHHRVEEPAKRNLKMDANDFQKEFRRLSMVFAPSRAIAIGARFV